LLGTYLCLGIIATSRELGLLEKEEIRENLEREGTKEHYPFIND
jgi:hypothetical protein